MKAMFTVSLPTSSGLAPVPSASFALLWGVSLSFSSRRSSNAVLRAAVLDGSPQPIRASFSAGFSSSSTSLLAATISCWRAVSCDEACHAWAAFSKEDVREVADMVQVVVNFDGCERDGENVMVHLHQTRMILISSSYNRDMTGVASFCCLPPTTKNTHLPLHGKA